jgi:TolB-like protein
MSLLAELKRRKVFRVAVVYAATAFVVLQAADLVAAGLALPAWVFSAITVLVIAGFPIALVLGWALDLTPQGVRVTEAASPQDPHAAEPLPALLGRRTALVSGALVVLGIGLGAGWFLKPAAVAAPDSLAPAVAIADKSVAVLPFADFSPGGGQEWFSDGLAEEILNALARLPDLRVASRTGSFQFRGHAGGVRAIADSLGVAHILEGSVRRTGERVRITAQLIRASDDVHLWSQNFDRDAADVIRVQEEIAFEIARTMRTALEPEALREMVNAGTNSVAAYEMYLRGQYLGRQSGLAGGSLEALAAFEEARTLDPQFSAAHGAAAMFWLAQMQPALSGSGVTDLPYRERERRAEERLAAAAATATDEVRRLRIEGARAELRLQLREAFTLARQASELVPSEQGALWSLASVAIRVGEYGVAGSAYQRAAELVENDARALVGIFNRSHRVDIDGALALGERALALDSTDLLVLYQSHRVLLWARRVREAATLAERFRAGGGDGQWLAIVQIRQACAEGRVDDAAAIYEQMSPGSLSWLALTYLGRHTEADELLRPMDDAGELYALAGYLNYTFFDPSSFPNLSATLRRQGISRTPVAIPYACRPGQAANSTAALH